MKRIVFIVVLAITTLLSGCYNYGDLPIPKDCPQNYFLEATFKGVNCLESFKDEANYTYENDSINISVTTFSTFPTRQYRARCVSSLHSIQEGEAFISVLYKGKVYHSFRGNVVMISSVVIDAYFYDLEDRTYTEYPMKIELLCKSN